MRELHITENPAQALSGQGKGARWSGRRSLLVALLVLGALVAPLLPGMGGRALAGQGATVVTDGLYLRSDANTGGPILDLMGYGDRVDILYGPFNNGWYQVRFNGTDGYAYGAYLELDGAGVGWSGGGQAVGGASDSAVAAPSSGPERWIDVNRSAQRVTLMIGDQAQASYSAAMGYDGSADGFYATAVGTYYVYSMSAALTYTDWAGAYIMDWVGFDPDRANGFHSYTMDANGNVIAGGDGPTGGCVATSPGEAAEIYNFAAIGMRVEVHF